MEENLTNIPIFNVYVNEEWVPIPAIRGTGIKFLGTWSVSGTDPSTGRPRTGTVYSFEDESKKQSDASYASDTFLIWNGTNGIDGTNGEGAVSSVDSIGPSAGGSNVILNAVSYGRVQALSIAEQSRARANIGAQPTGDYFINPSNKRANEFLKYLGNEQWTTDSVQILPQSTDIGLLMKMSGDMSNLTWVPIANTEEINEIFDE